jgi:hypothetical protein
MMPSRYAQLVEALAGVQKSNVPLVAFNGTRFEPAGAPDDVGSYYLIPGLAILLGTPIERAIDVFYFALLITAFIISTGGLFLSLDSNAAKWLSLIWVAIVLGSACLSGDVYIVTAFLPLTFVPWLAFLMCERRKRDRFLAPFLLAEGLFVGIAHTVRAHSGTALVIFTLCIVLFQIDASHVRKVWLMVVLTIGFVIPQLYMGTLVERRDAFLASTCHTCPRVATQHVFWHTAYLGLGFLSNPYVPKYDDSVAFDLVHTVSPGTVYGTEEYERILRGEVVALVRNHPDLIVTTLAAKIGVIALVLLMSANVGLLAAIYHRKPWPIELGFWGAIAFSSLPGLLAKPTSTHYMLGLVSFASLYGMSSVSVAIKGGALRDLKRVIEKLMQTSGLRTVRGGVGSGNGEVRI